MSVARFSEALSYERDLNVKRKEILEFIRTAEEKALSPITLSQAEQVLAEAGMVAVPLEPTQAMKDAVDGAQDAGIWPEGICRDMIAAAQEKPDA